MMQRDNEFGRFLRRSLHEAAESVVIGDDGLTRPTALDVVMSRSPATT
jgi:hypothetical protein